MFNHSYTAVFVSAWLLTTAAGISQTQAVPNQNLAASNFYITTPQTGERQAVGAASPSVTAPASPNVANTYLTQTPRQTAQKPASTARQGRRNSGSATATVTPAYSVQQVSNSPAAYQTQQTAANYYVSAQQSQQVVSTSAQAASNSQPSTQQTVNPAYVSNASSNDTGFLSRLLHSKPSGGKQQQQQPGAIRQVSNQVGNLAGKASRSVSYGASKLAGTMQQGMASWYGQDWHGKKTANGERYDMDSMTAAHKTLPFGTVVKVQNERNGRECLVRINNRGPFSKGRVLDLSRAAARQLDMVGSGVAKIKMQVVGKS